MKYKGIIIGATVVVVLLTSLYAYEYYKEIERQKVYETPISYEDALRNLQSSN